MAAASMLVAGDAARLAPALPEAPPSVPAGVVSSDGLAITGKAAPCPRLPASALASLVGMPPPEVLRRNGWTDLPLAGPAPPVGMPAPGATTNCAPELPAGLPSAGVPGG